MVGPAQPSIGSAPVELEELLGRHEPLHPPTTTAGAAVVIVLREGGRDLETLLIERTARPDDPASGQVAFPGGRVAESDGSLATTALRELEEEVGLTRSDLDGPLRFVTVTRASRFGLDVGVFVGALGKVARPPTPRSAKEVAHVFWLPRSSLIDTRRVVRDTLFGELEVPATVFHGHVLWGFTRRVLREFFGLPVEDEAFGPPFVADSHP